MANKNFIHHKNQHSTTGKLDRSSEVIRPFPKKSGLEWGALLEIFWVIL